MLRTALAGLVALSATACVHTAGNFEPNRFQSSSYPYAINYTKQGEQSALLGEDWRVDNYMKSTVGASRNKYVLKKGPEYWVERGYDDNDDGQVDRKKKEPFYDLSLEHRVRDAALWVRMVPISKSDQRKELSVFAERYVESVAGTGMIAVHFGAEATVSVSKRFASRVLSTAECTVGDKPAQVLDFEVANVDQLQLSEDSRWSRGRLAIIRTGYTTPVVGGSSFASKQSYPVLMLVGLSAAPADFDALSADFDDLLGRIALGQPAARRETHATWTAGTTCKLGAAPAPEADAPVTSPEMPSSGGESVPEAASDPAAPAAPAAPVAPAAPSAPVAPAVPSAPPAPSAAPAPAATAAPVAPQSAQASR